MRCLNLSLPQVKKDLTELTSILGDEKAAYAALAYNEGFPMDSTSMGNPSIMFQELQKLTNDYKRSTVLKANAMSSAFAEKFGDWVSESNDVGVLTKQGEPKVFSQNGFDYYIDKKANILPIFPGHNYSGVNVNKTMQGQTAKAFLSDTPFNTFLADKADKYGIKMRSAKTSKFKNLLRDIIERDTQRLTPSKRSIQEKRIEDFVSKLQDYSEYEDVQEILTIYQEGGQQALVDTIWDSSKANTLNNLVAEDHPKMIEDVTFYDKLRDIALYPLGDEIHTFGEARLTIDNALGVTTEFESKELSTQRDNRLSTIAKLNKGKTVKIQYSSYKGSFNAKFTGRAVEVGRSEIHKDDGTITVQEIYYALEFKTNTGKLVTATEHEIETPYLTSETKAVDPIQQAMTDANVKPKNKALFVKRLNAILNYTKDNPETITEELASADYLVALKVMDDALTDMISEGEDISDTYYTKLFETVQQLYLNSKPEKVELPYKRKSIAKYSTEDIILIRAESKEDVIRSNGIIEDAIEDGAYTFVFAPDNIATKHEKEISEKLIDRGAKKTKKNGAIYITVQSAPTKITDNKIVTPTVTKPETFKTPENTKVDKAVVVSFNSKAVDKEVSFYEDKVTGIKYKLNFYNVNEVVKTAKDNPNRLFYINSSSKAILDKVFKSKLSLGGYPSNLVLTEKAVEYLKTKQEVYNKKNPHTINDSSTKSDIKTKINKVEDQQTELESKTFEDAYGNNMEATSFQKDIYDLTSKHNFPYSENIVNISSFLSGSTKEKALFSIAPKDVLYVDETDKDITVLNKRLWAEISNDQKANKVAYSLYKKGIIDVLARKRLAKDKAIEQFLGGETKQKSKVEEEIEDDEVLSQQSSLEELENVAERDIKFIQDVLTGDSITHEDFLSARQRIEQWQTVGDFSNPERNPFLTLAAIDDANVKATFRGFANTVTELEKSLNVLGAQLTTNDVNSNLKKAFTFDDIIKLKSKVTGFIKNFFSLAHVDNPIVAHVLKLIDTVQKKATIEAITDSERLADLYKKAVDSGFDPKEMYQVDEDGVPTGMLVNPASYEYSEKMDVAKKSATGMIEIRNESIVIDILKIQSVGRTEYANSLLGVIDPNKLNDAMDEAETKYNEYIALRESFMQVNFGIPYSENASLSKRDKNKLNRFLEDNNPILRIKGYQNKNITSYTNLPGKVKDKYVTVIPKQRKKMSTGWYDKTFERIRNNPDAYALWNFAQEITKRAKQNYNMESLSDYALSSVYKDVIDMFREKGVSKMTLKATGDYFMKEITSRTQEIDKEYDVSGREIKKVKRGAPTLEFAIYDEMQKIRNTEYSNVDKVSEATWKTIFKQASNVVMSGDKMDIFAALNNLNLSSRAFAYKSAIKPQIDVAMHYIQMIEVGRARGSKAMSIAEKDLSNALDMTQYFVDKELYNISTPDRSYKLPIVYYNIQEREIRDGIVREMDRINKKKVLSPDDIDNLHILQEKLDSMGKNLTINSVIDALTKYMRFTTLGWNFANAFANLGQGMFANFIYGFEAKFYTLSDLKDAHVAMATNRSKFRSMMHNFDILGDVTYGFSSVNPFTKEEGLKGVAKELLDPYAGVSIAEEINQGFVAIAMMINKTVVNTETGEIISFWDALSEKGKLADIYEYDGKTGSDAAAAMALLVGQQINRIHGDYTSSLKINEQAPGRAVTLFHRWFFDPYMARFGAKRYNYMLDTEVKGYYRSIFSTFQEYGIDYKKFLKDVREGNIDQTEMENLRKVLGEMTVSLTALALAALAKLALCSDLKECSGPEKYIINALNRIEGESRMFSSPEQWYDLITNPVATTKYVKDLSDLSGYITDWAQGDLKDEFGENPIWKITKKNIPLLRRLEIGKDLTEYIH